jgi:hypothetical protein
MMRSILPLSSALFLVSLAAFAIPTAGCSANGDEGVGSSEGADTAGDLADAQFVVNLLGGQNGKCNGCHGVTQATVQRWGQALTDVEKSCFAPSLSATEQVNCLRSTPGQASASFAPKRLGLYATAAATDPFKKLFTAAFPNDPSEFSKFTQAVAMPRAGTPLTGDEFSRR